MFQKILTSMFGTKHERDMKKLRPTIEKINSLEAVLQGLSDEQLKAKTPEFKERLTKGETLDDILPEAFAVCREASKRVLGMRHYDVQLIGGLVLHRGTIAEMKTGEGKTLVATLPTYLNALSGRGVHVVTVNDYLAKRDTEWMGRLYNWLGLSTGTIVHDLSDQERQEAYGADITYGTNNEFGFDYLRDNMKFDLKDYVQRELNFAIIDECDSILVDEARTPLIISGPKDDSTEKYGEIDKVIPHLKLDVHFTMEEKSKTASLTEEGNAKVEQLLGIGNLYDPEYIDLLHHIYQALKAHHLYKLDVDYMIKDGEIVIVDEFTGRLMPGRRWSDGLHQAIEAKEKVKVRNENQTLATITFQNYFRMYNKMAGMTGTAETEAVEFKKIYNLDVQVIPTNRAISRKDLEDVVYKNEAAKFRAMAKDIRERNVKGQPVLVGTVSIEKSERLSRMLKNEGITHNVLNAKHHEREAEIVAQAGRKNGVTIATNMAGRGTDILLGGNAEFMAKAEIGHDAPEEKIAEVEKKYRDLCESEKKDVIAAGGLYIMGTERHESRRIDNQLRGRAGRQGDPGESKFYLSLEDNLMRIFNGERIQKIMTMLKVDEDEPITARMVSNAVRDAQKRVEGHNFDIRKHLIEYDDVMNQQRTAIYSLRRQILAGEDLERKLLDMLSEVTSATLDAFIPEDGKRDSWNIEGLMLSVQRQFGIQLSESELQGLSAQQITDMLGAKVKEAYDRQKAEIGGFFDQLGRMLLLQTIDQRWKEHLERIDHLKEGIHLRAHAQKDPLIEYKKEAFTAFQELNAGIEQETVEKLLKIRLVSQDRARQVLNERHELDQSGLSYAGADENPNAYINTGARPGPSAVEAAPPLNSGGPMQYSYGPPDGDDGPGPNREQRRRMKKDGKKKKIKF
ncbi:MAG TPA: preprotein translocase subunit SecA [Bdellovibrionales bacterium]|nr:preprotein translocase subunit SecA [Bdellovibrionales bacterium]